MASWRLWIVAKIIVLYVSFILQTLVIPASMRTTVNVGTLTIRAKPPQDKEVSCRCIQYKSFNCHCSPLPCTCTCINLMLVKCTLHRIFFLCAIVVRPPTPSSTTLATSASTANSLLNSLSSHLVGQPSHRL